LNELTIINIFVGIFTVAFLCLAVWNWFSKKREQLKNKQLQKKYDKLLTQKKSSEVRLGKVAENMAPFFSDWPYDPNRFRFLGNPIDGISFNDDEVVFVEIKSGGARLSKSQKHVKELVRAGKIKFVSFRVDDTGSSLKLESEPEEND
jgi:predicted Holliday junction resolvase-like endonuclease